MMYFTQPRHLPQQSRYNEATYRRPQDPRHSKTNRGGFSSTPANANSPHTNQGPTTSWLPTDHPLARQRAQRSGATGKEKLQNAKQGPLFQVPGPKESPVEFIVPSKPRTKPFLQQSNPAPQFSRQGPGLTTNQQNSFGWMTKEQMSKLVRAERPTPSRFDNRPPGQERRGQYQQRPDVQANALVEVHRADVPRTPTDAIPPELPTRPTTLPKVNPNQFIPNEPQITSSQPNAENAIIPQDEGVSNGVGPPVANYAADESLKRSVNPYPPPPQPLPVSTQSQPQIENKGYYPGDGPQNPAVQHNHDEIIAEEGTPPAIDNTYRYQVTLPNGTMVFVYVADITRLMVDAVVNAANEKLKHSGGVAKAISKAAGKDLQRESNNYVELYGRVEVGNVAVTQGWKLPCRKVIHAVGPMWAGKKKTKKTQQQLTKTLDRALDRAEELGMITLAMPPICAGIFGVPIDIVGESLAEAIMSFDQTIEPPHNLNDLKEIHVVDIDSNIVMNIAEKFRKKFGNHLQRVPNEAIPDQPNRIERKGHRPGEQLYARVSKVKGKGDKAITHNDAYSGKQNNGPVGQSVSEPPNNIPSQKAAYSNQPQPQMAKDDALVQYKQTQQNAFFQPNNLAYQDNPGYGVVSRPGSPPNNLAYQDNPGYGVASRPGAQSDSASHFNQTPTDQGQTPRSHHTGGYHDNPGYGMVQSGPDKRQHTNQPSNDHRQSLNGPHTGGYHDNPGYGMVQSGPDKRQHTNQPSNDHRQSLNGPHTGGYHDNPGYGMVQTGPGRDQHSKQGPPEFQFSVRPPTPENVDQPATLDFGNEPPFHQNGNQAPPAQYRNQPPARQAGHQPPPAQYGNQPPSHQYGHQPPPAQYGNQPPPAQYGNQPPPAQYGNQPPPSQYRNQPPPHQYGNQPPSHQYGQQPPPAQYGNQPPPAQYGNQPPPSNQYGNQPPASKYGKQPAGPQYNYQAQGDQFRRQTVGSQVHGSSQTVGTQAHGSQPAGPEDQESKPSEFFFGYHSQDPESSGNQQTGNEFNKVEHNELYGYNGRYGPNPAYAMERQQSAHYSAGGGFSDPHQPDSAGAPAEGYRVYQNSEHSKGSAKNCVVQ